VFNSLEEGRRRQKREKGLAYPLNRCCKEV